MKARWLALAFLASGCATGPLDVSEHPGATLLTTAPAVAGEYACDERRLPWLGLEANAIVPAPVAAGGEFAHRLVTVMCPVYPEQRLVGALRTRIRLGDDVVADDTVQAFEIAPGRWRVDALVTLPPEATLGVYTLEVQFESRDHKTRFEDRVPFGVVAPTALASRAPKR